MARFRALRSSGPLRVFIIGVACLLTACNPPPAEPLRIASSPWPGYEPLYLARDLGYLKPGNANLFELPSADITMESFRNRSTDLATLTLDETLELLHDGTQLRILLVLDSSNGADAVVARPEIKSLADLKGKRIALENIPLGMYMLTRLLDAAGLTRQDVTVIPMAESKHEQYFRQGKADAVITFEPFRTKLLEAGGHVIFDSSKIPNEIFDLLLVHEDVYQKRRTELCNVVGEWYRTLAYMQAQPADTASRISKRLKVTENDYRQMVQGIIVPSREDNRRLLAGASPALLTPAAKLAVMMQTEGQLKHPVDAGAAIDATFQDCIRQ